VRPDPSGHPLWQPKTIFRALNDAGVSWRYYYDSGIFLANFADWNDPTIKGKTYNIQNWYDVLSGKFGDADKYLPQVIFIESHLDEHPDKNIQTQGAANVQKIISALMNSSAWKSSVFIYTFDEAGGGYEHVPPFPVPEPDQYQPGQCPEPASPGSCLWKSTDIQGKFNLTGMRIPLIVISPWAKPHYVSHVQRDYTAILAFIENTFHIPALNARDAYFQNPTRDMSEFFDFTTPALLNAPNGQPWVNFLPVQPTNGTDKWTWETCGSTAVWSGAACP
jgi:phospholipase C